MITFPVLFWNEGRAVKTRKDLNEGAKDFVQVSADTVDPANDGKLVHLSGAAETPVELADEALGIRTKALVLKRKVEMYQWKQSTDTKTKKKLGGSEEKTITYNYTKTWSEGRIDSSNFKKPAGHENPSLPVTSSSWTASPVTVGAFTLSKDLVSKLNDYQPLTVAETTELPEKIAEREVKLSGGQIYLAKDTANPVVGDVRISYQQVEPSVVSLISKQKGSSFEPFTGSKGTTINMIQTGEHSAEAMFERAQESNKMMSWILRLVGFVLMFMGFSLIFKPLSVVADVLPIAGTIVGVGTGIVAFLLAAPLSLATISIAWIFYRPLIGIPLLLAAAVGIFFLVKKVIAYKKAQA
ncbi:TMEM43 family protein [Verrucomicrobiaceae bacterium R5-34]|nr:TMEM43 family protein [Verrucomicrobiaceae bacterium R5-34]